MNDGIEAKFHDAKITSIAVNPIRPEVCISTSDNGSLLARGTVLFRSESYFARNRFPNAPTELRISSVRISSGGWLVREVLNQQKPNGEKKWGDDDQKNFNIRPDSLIHLHFYCIDWEFDIVCESFEVQE